MNKIGDTGSGVAGAQVSRLQEPARQSAPASGRRGLRSARGTQRTEQQQAARMRQPEQSPTQRQDAAVQQSRTQDVRRQRDQNHQLQMEMRRGQGQVLDTLA